MRSHAGQAIRRVLQFIRRVTSLLLALLVVALAGIGAFGWLLSQGPVEVPWLVRRLEAAVNVEGGPRWSIGRVALAWEGFGGAADRPIDLRIADVTVTGADGAPLGRIPSAHVSLAMTELLRGHVVPSAIELEGARLRATRGADGRVRIDLVEAVTGGGDVAPAMDLAEVAAALARPAGTAGEDSAAGRLLDHLRRVQVRDAGLVVVDERLGMRWTASEVTLDLRRDAAGGAVGAMALSLALGSQRVRLSGEVALHDGPEFVKIRAAMSPVNPARLAIEMPMFAAGMPVDAPLSIEGSLVFDRALRWQGGAATARLGVGQVLVIRGMLPVAAAEATLHASRDTVVLSTASVDLQPAGRPVTRVTGTGALSRDADGVTIELNVGAEHAELVDLPSLWPDGVGGSGAKPWLVENMPSGTVRNLRANVTLRGARDLSDLRVTTLSGGGDGQDLVVHWLRPVPPVEQGVARLDFVSPDILDITMISGRQGGMKVTGGLMRIHGLSVRDQVTDITVDAAGPLADLFTVLRHPRIRLLDRRPLELRDPAGQVKGRLEIIRMPLESWLTMDDVQLRASVRGTGVHLGGVAAGRDLDDGQLDLQASNDGLRVTGTANLAGIPAKLLMDMDFRPGGAAQIVQSVTVSGTPVAAQVAALGIDLAGMVSGTAPVSAVWRTRRDGKGDVAVKADLTAASLAVARLNFVKPPGRPAQAEMRMLLERDRVAGIERLTVKGEGIDAEARVAFAEGRPVSAVIPNLVLGRDTNLHADIRFPPQAGGAWTIALGGSSLDASTEFARRPPGTPKPPETRGPAYAIDAKLDRVVLGPGRSINQMVLRAENDGLINRQLRLSGRPGGLAPFDIAITSTPGDRSLTGNAADAGGLLKMLDIVEDMQGGTMKLSGRYDDGKPGRPLQGTAEINDFRMTKAPALAKLLQAMTLYGLVELVRGPGLGFARLDAPFRLTEDVLELEDARAFNTSLGMTAKGRADIAAQRCDMSGTIVPAYFFNSMLGGIPLIGKLFSPERGGGLFAATYSLRGDCNDPTVSVNPLAALTPGFLRGIFGIFDGPAGTGTKTPPPSNPAPVGR
ncbi:MAG: DUF3971 domain-containing protein [Alphaproteobacteria bacterium]|nr:DUF3971 domain-containing protein [Alphaproteobacteria bacterium]